MKTKELILNQICSKYKVSRKDLLSKTRKQPVSKARQEAMYLFFKDLNIHQEDIAKFFNRDRTTVFYAVKINEKNEVSKVSKNKNDSDFFNCIIHERKNLLTKLEAINNLIKFYDL